jgi:F420-non-reducing hydrogenase small subunit
MAKVPVSFEWLSVCSGCEVGTVDLHERLLKVLEAVEIVRLPILADVKDYPKAKVGVVSGALRTDHDIECAEKMRETCDAILAFGTCAVYGGPQGSGYAHTTQELVETAYLQNPTTTTHFLPDQAGVPKLLEEGVRPLDSVIDVDLYLPGCPPHAYYIFEALVALVEGRDPEFGEQNVCYKCNRKMRHSEVDRIRRIHEIDIDPDLCFLSQGIVCLGSVTLDRCLAPCPRHGVPCTGCAGPSEAVILEPQKDVRTEIATRMSMMTKIPKEDIVKDIEKQSKTHYAYAMASPVFRQKPTFLLRRWIGREGALR